MKPGVLRSLKRIWSQVPVTPVRNLPALLVLSSFLLAGCNLPTGTARADVQATEAAATLAARLTQVVAIFTETAQAASATPTPSPTSTSTPTLTSTPFFTPTQTLHPVLQDAARFVMDVTVPDGTKYQRRAKFTKSWRLMNIGLSTWTSEFSLVYVTGDRMGGALEQPLKGSVQPGYMVDLSVELVAPDLNGDYRGFWALKNPQGEIFGIGADGRGTFWADIEVDSPSEVVYDFAARYCDAVWRSEIRVLPCPGDPADSDGFVIRIEAPPLENRVEDEPGLWTEPEWVDGGYIQGTYPEFEVRQQDRFRTLISCHSESPDCDVRFRLDYRIDGGPIQTLAKWNERFDGSYTKVDLGLDALAGKRVQFILTVLAKDVYAMDSAIWVRPTLWR
jgi:predicted small secreted protein